MTEDNADGKKNDNKNIFHTLAQPGPVRTVNNYLDVLSEPYETSKSEANISSLPVEGNIRFAVKLSNKNGNKFCIFSSSVDIFLFGRHIALQCQRG